MSGERVMSGSSLGEAEQGTGRARALFPNFAFRTTDLKPH